MNQERFEKFGIAYRTGLRLALERDANRPDSEKKYAYGIDQLETAVTNILRAIQDNPKMVNYTSSDGFRLACKELGIKHTVRDILAFLKANDVY